MTDPLYNDTPKPKRNMKPFIFIAIIAVAIIIGAVILGGGLPFLNPAPAPTTPSTSQGPGLTIDEGASDEKYVQQGTVSHGVAIPGFASMTIPPYTTTVQGINLENPIENEGYYYLTYTLYLLDENEQVSETLYKSNLLPPGKYLQNIELSRGLAPGTYQAMMFVQPYRIADQSATNNANYKITITVV